MVAPVWPRTGGVGANDSSSARTDRSSPARTRSTTSVTPEPGVVLQLAFVGDGAEGDDRERGGVAPGLPRPGRAGAGWPRPGRCRRWGSSRRHTRRRRASTLSVGAAADEGAHPRPLQRLRPRPGRAEVDELAVVLGLVGRPDGLHGGEVLPHDRVAAAEFDAVVLGLGPVPAEADPERDAAAREVVEGRHLLGQNDGVVLRGQQDAGAQSDARSSRRPRSPARRAGRGSACSRRGARRRRAPAACPRGRADGCARAGRASRSRAPRPRRPVRQVPGRGR